jgi:hypothetical protein
MKKFLVFFIISPACVFAQNVGIGIAAPASKLHISGNGISGHLQPAILITDSLPQAGGALRFKQATNNVGMRISLFSGSNFNIGQYLDIGSDSQVVATFQGSGRLGIRTLAPAYTLDVAGDINTNGTIRVNGNAGANGQVLTSNGTADPSWQTLAETYPSADRVMVPFLSTPLPGAAFAPVIFGAARYNLNTSNFTVGLSFITVNTTGLYEIEGAVTYNSGIVTVAAGGSPYGALVLRTVSGAVTTDYNLARERIDQFSVSPSTSFTETVNYKIKLHLVAGTTVSLRGIIYQYISGSSAEIEEGFIGMVLVN